MGSVIHRSLINLVHSEIERGAVGWMPVNEGSLLHFSTEQLLPVSGSHPSNKRVVDRNNVSSLEVQAKDAIAC